MGVININFYEDIIHSMNRRYTYEDDWISPIKTKTQKSGISTINIEIIYLNEKTIECINELGSKLNVVENITKFKFTVHETEINKVNVAFCNALISLIRKLVNLHRIEIRTSEQLRAIYEYIILESKIIRLEIDIYDDYEYKNGVVCISNIFKIAGNNSCIRIMEFIGARWKETAEILESYPQLEELVIHRRNFYHLEKLSETANEKSRKQSKKETT